MLRIPMRMMRNKRIWLGALLLLIGCAVVMLPPQVELFERAADESRVSQQPEEWMEEDMQKAATVLRLRLEQEHVQVNTEEYHNYNIVFHAVVEECLLGDIPVGAKVRVEAADIEESAHPEADEASRAGRRLEMKIDHGGRRTWLVLLADDGLTAVPGENLYFWSTGVSLGMPGLWWGERTEKLVQKYLPLWAERKRLKAAP